MVGRWSFDNDKYKFWGVARAAFRVENYGRNENVDYQTFYWFAFE